MAIRLSREDAKRLGIDRPKAPSSKGMTKPERTCQARLEAYRAAGDVLWYAFEPMKLRLADRTFFLPDFAVQWRQERELAFIECKGPYVREDGWLKLKIAAAQFPFAFYLFQLGGSGEERFERLPSRRGVQI